TRWRALLTASLDQTRATVTGACVRSAPDNAPATLLAAWLSERLGVSVGRVDGEHPGVNEVVLTTDKGDIVLSRVREGTAHYRVPGQPDRTVALRRRPLTDLITEELQRMDADDVFEAAVQRVVKDLGAS
ncbi:OpcA/G6PD domain-containing protein, partial [Tessaracoccus lubricantis]